MGPTTTVLTFDGMATNIAEAISLGCNLRVNENPLVSFKHPSSIDQLNAIQDLIANQSLFSFMCKLFYQLYFSGVKLVICPKSENKSDVGCSNIEPKHDPCS